MQEYPLMNKLILGGLLTLGLMGAGQAQRGQVSIDQDPGIGKLLEIYKEANASAGFYTIQIGFGTYDYAEALKGEVSLEFPEYEPRVVFDSPTYRVQVGQFRNRLEAEKKYIEVRRKFPGALLLKPE